MPYASITGAAKVASNAAATDGGNDAEDDRTNRRGARAMIAAWTGALSRIARCMVGTAVYQVGRQVSNHPKNSGARNPGVQTIYVPAVNEASAAATSPWMWNSGRASTRRSSGTHRQARWRASALARRLPWLSTAPLGAPVVPEV